MHHEVMKCNLSFPQIKPERGVNASQVLHSLVKFSEALRSLYYTFFLQDEELSTNPGARERRSALQGLDAVVAEFPPVNDEKIESIKDVTETVKDISENL